MYVATDTHSCLKKSDTDHSLYLDHDHTYYFQVQTQIFICQVEYADLCVCTFPSESTPQIHIERIYPDFEMWQTCIVHISFKHAYHLSHWEDGIPEILL